MLTRLDRGASDRLRPVLMASLLALVGLAADGDLNRCRQRDAAPVRAGRGGGMLTTLVVALFVLPVFYSLITPPS